jgi:hypothetical protein
MTEYTYKVARNRKSVPGYKGSNKTDTAAYYAPYIPLQKYTMNNTGKIKWWKVNRIDKQTGWSVYEVDDEIETWIAKQPYHLWEIYHIPPDDLYIFTWPKNVYSLSPQVEAWFLLRWS